MLTNEEEIAMTLRDYVANEVPLGIYTPLSPRRPRVSVMSFDIEYLDIDENLIAHVAGPVVLQTPTGNAEKFLRVSVPITAVGTICENGDVRAAYIEETNPETGACKETAALANE